MSRSYGDRCDRVIDEVTAGRAAKEEGDGGHL
jgi:hypothetical protein